MSTNAGREMKGWVQDRYKHVLGVPPAELAQKKENHHRFLH